MQNASTMSIAAAPAQAGGYYALRDFTHAGVRIFEGEDFPIVGLADGDLRNLRGAGFVGFGTVPSGSVRHGRDRRAVYEAKQRATAQAAEILSEADLEAATAPATASPKKKR